MPQYDVFENGTNVHLGVVYAGDKNRAQNLASSQYYGKSVHVEDPTQYQEPVSQVSIPQKRNPMGDLKGSIDRMLGK